MRLRLSLLVVCFLLTALSGCGCEGKSHDFARSNVGPEEKLREIEAREAGKSAPVMRTVTRGEEAKGSASLEKITSDGERAIRSKAFAEAEAALATGDFRAAKRAYEKIGAEMPGNTFVRRRLDRITFKEQSLQAAREPALQQAYTAALRGHTDAALSAAAGISINDNPFLAARVHAIRAMAFRSAGDEKKASEEEDAAAGARLKLVELDAASYTPSIK